MNELNLTIANADKLIDDTLIEELISMAAKGESLLFIQSYIKADLTFKLTNSFNAWLKREKGTDLDGLANEIIAAAAAQAVNV